MTLTISIPPEAADKLQEQAQALGLDVQAYALRILENSINSHRLFEEARAEIYKRFLESGMTDEELGEELERAKHEMRAERRARGGA